MRANIFRFISILIAVTFLSQNMAWSAPIQAPSDISYQPSANLFIPEQYGRIERLNWRTGQLADRPTVILVKDAHCHYEAQRNIERILDILIRDYKIDLACVEGASGNVDTSILGVYPDKKKREIVTDKYVREGLFTASEALGIKNGFNPGFTIFGVENEKLYWKNFKAFRDTVGRIEYGERFIKLIGDIILQLKNRIYTEELQHFDRKAWEYRKNEISLTEWIKFLAEQMSDINKYKNINLVIRATELENRIDFKAVESERANLIRELEKTLPKEGLRELVEKSLLFKLGKISPLDYYKYMGQYTDETSGQNLVWYIHLIKLHSLIDENGLFSELEEIEESVYDNLFQNELQRKLHNLDKEIYIFNKIIHLQATRDEIVYYSRNRQMFSAENIMEFVRIQAISNGINLPGELNDPSFLDNANQVLLPADEFYKIATERDEALVSNLLQQMEEEGKQKAVLIAGGFHGDGIRKLLEERNVGLITITPTITKTQEDSRELYLKRMLDPRTDPDQILAETGYSNLQAVLACTNRNLLEDPVKDLVDLVKMPFQEALQRADPQSAQILRQLYELVKTEHAGEELSLMDLLKNESFRNKLINMYNGQGEGSLPWKFLGGVLRECGIELHEKPTITVGNALGTEGYYTDNNLQEGLDKAIADCMKEKYTSLVWNPRKKQWMVTDNNGKEWLLWDGNWKEWDKGQNVWREPQTQPDFSGWGITSEKLSGLAEYVKRLDLSGDLTIRILGNDNIFLHQKENQYALAHGGSYQGMGRFVYMNRGLFNLLSAECLYELFTEESTHAEESFLQRKTTRKAMPGEKSKTENRLRLFYMNMFILKKLLEKGEGVENMVIQKILIEEGLGSFQRNRLQEFCTHISDGFDSIIKGDHLAAKQNFRDAFKALITYKNSRAYENLQLILSQDMPFLSVDGDMEPITKRQQKYNCVLLNNKLKNIYGLEEKVEMIPKGVEVYLIGSEECNYLTCKIFLNQDGTISKLYINRALFSDLRPNLLKRLFDAKLLGTEGSDLFQRTVQDIKVYLYIFHGKEYFEGGKDLTNLGEKLLLKLLPRPLRKWVLDSKSSDGKRTRLGCIYQGYISLYSCIILEEDGKTHSEQDDFYQMANQILPEMPVPAKKPTKKAVLFGFEQRRSDFEKVDELLKRQQDNGVCRHENGEYKPFTSTDKDKPIDEKLRREILKKLGIIIRNFGIFREEFGSENEEVIEGMREFTNSLNIFTFSGDNGWIKVEEEGGETPETRIRRIYINEKFVNSSEDPDIREKALFFALFCVFFRWQHPAGSKFINKEELLFLISFGYEDAKKILGFFEGVVGIGGSYIWKLIRIELIELKNDNGNYRERLNKYNKIHGPVPFFRSLAWHFRNRTIWAKVIWGISIFLTFLIGCSVVIFMPSRADIYKAEARENVTAAVAKFQPEMAGINLTPGALEEMAGAHPFTDENNISNTIPPPAPGEEDVVYTYQGAVGVPIIFRIPQTYFNAIRDYLNTNANDGTEIRTMEDIIKKLIERSREFAGDTGEEDILEYNSVKGFQEALNIYLGKAQQRPYRSQNVLVSGYVEWGGDASSAQEQQDAFIKAAKILAGVLNVDEVLYFHMPINKEGFDERKGYEDAGIRFVSPGEQERGIRWMSNTDYYNIGYAQALQLLANLGIINPFLFAHSNRYENGLEVVGLAVEPAIGLEISLYFGNTASVYMLGCASGKYAEVHASQLVPIAKYIATTGNMPNPLAKDSPVGDPEVANTPEGIVKISDGIYLIPAGGVYSSDVVLFTPAFKGRITREAANKIAEEIVKISHNKEWEWNGRSRRDIIAEGGHHRFLRVVVIRDENETNEDFLERVKEVFNLIKRTGKKVAGGVGLYNRNLKPLNVGNVVGPNAGHNLNAWRNVRPNLNVGPNSRPRGGGIGKWVAEGDLVVQDGCLIGELKGIGENKERTVKLVKESEYETQLVNKKKDEEVVVIKVEKSETPKLKEAIVKLAGRRKINPPSVYSISSNPYIQGYGSKDAVFVNEELLNVPGGVGFMALIHEVGHVLIANGTLTIEQILGGLKPKWKEWYRNKLLIYDEDVSAHYALRALQRQINEKADLELSRRLKELYLPDKIRNAAQKIKAGLKEKGVGIDKDIETIKGIIEEALKKKDVVNLKELLSALKIAPKKFFVAAVVVAKAMEGLVRNNTEVVGKVAKVLDGILSEYRIVIKDDNLKQKEDAVLDAIKKDLMDRGIDPDALGLDSIFEGLYLLRFDPMLDITEVDANYPDYIKALGSCLGPEFSLDSIFRAFAENAVRKGVAGSKVDNLEEVVGRICSPTSGIGESDTDKVIRRKGLEGFRKLYEALTGKEMPLVELPDSKLKKYFHRASLYARINNCNEIKDMDLEFEDELLENLDFRSNKVTISGNVQAYISSQDAVAEGVDRFLGETVRSDRETIVCDDIDNYIDFDPKSLQIEETEDGTLRIGFHHEAGLRAVLDRIKSGKLVFYNCGGNITRNGKIYERSAIVREILKTTGMLDDKIFMTEEGKSVEGLLGSLPRGTAVTILLNKGLKGDLESNAQKYKQDNLRFVEISEGPFYARLLFGFMYGGLETVTKEAVGDLLTQFGVDKKEIEEIRNNFNQVLLTVKLIKMKEILEKYKNTRISINTAA